MQLLEKRKAFFYASVLVLVLVTLFVLRTPYMQARSVARAFNRWTSPSLGRGGLLVWSLATKFAIPRLERIIAEDCNAIDVYPDGRIYTSTGRLYAHSVGGTWFVWNINRIILSGPVIEPNGNDYIARTTEFLNDHSKIELMEVELFIKKYGSKYLISRIKNTRKNPTDEQLSKFQDMLKVRRYAPDEGFGGRYNEFYTFSAMGFSPDGKRIVFSPFTLKSSDIYVINVDGSGLTRLTDTEYWEVAPQFTPDGKKIMFTSDKENYAGEIYLIDLDGSNYRRLAPNYFGVTEACFSPDGNSIAFTSQKGTAREVYIMNAEGSNIKKLTNSGNQCSSLKFSPDGKKLFFVQIVGEVFSVNVDGTDLRQLTPARTRNAYNERVLDITDKYVFFVHVVQEDTSIDLSKRPNDHEIWQMMYDGREQNRIVGGEITNSSYKYAKVISNGKSIIFVDSQPAKPFTYDLRIKSLTNAENAIQLTKDGSCRDSRITVSPDGKYVAYMLFAQNKETIGIRILSVDGKESWTIADNWSK